MDARTLRDEFKENIQAGLLDNEIGHYFVFIPKQISKKTTKSLRKTIHLIAFSKLQEIRRFILEISNDICQKIEGRSEKKLLHFFESFKKTTPYLNQDDLIWLEKEKYLKELLESIDEVLKSKSLALVGELAFLFNELKVWLEAFWVHAGMNVKRQQIQALLSLPNKQEMVKFYVKEKQHADLTAGMFDALDLISNMETEEIQPIILFLIKGVEYLSHRNAEIKRFCQMCFEKIWETIELDYEGDMAKLNFLAKKKGSILVELKDLKNTAEGVEVGPSISGLMTELAFFLKGLYLYFYKKSKAWGAGAKNMAIRSKTGGEISDMLTIADFYYQYAMLLESKMQPILQNTSSVSMPKVELVNPIEPTIEALMMSLVEYEEMDGNGKIHGLKYSLETVGVPAKLCAKINSVVIDSAKEELKKYIDTVRGASGVGAWMYQTAKCCVSQNHLLQAERVLDVLTRSVDVKTNLLAIVALRNELYVNNSGNLKPAIDAVLLNAFKLLRGKDRDDAAQPIAASGLHKV